MSRRSLGELAAALFAPVRFVLDDITYTVPEHPLADWLTAIGTGGPDAIVPALLADEDAGALYLRLTDPDEPLPMEVVEGIGFWVLEELCDRPWWEVHRAVGIALSSWNVFDAWCRDECGGTDPAALTLRALVNLVVRFMVLTRAEESDREDWLTSFAAPPPGSEAEMEARPEWAEDSVAADAMDAMADWSAMKMQMQAGPGPG